MAEKITLKDAEIKTGEVKDLNLRERDFDTSEKERKLAGKKKIQLERERDAKLVKGKFMFHEVPGGTLRFNFHKYKGDPVKTYELQDGEIYTLPLGVAKHLNTDVGYPVHAHSLDENGKPSMKIGKFERRCSFQSLEFMVDEDFSPSELLTVERI